MPRTRVVFYRDEAGKVPVVEWLEALRRTDHKAYAKCVVRIRRLAEMGHELRRPEADFLRDGIYELRAKKGRVNYRLYISFMVPRWRLSGMRSQRKELSRMPKLSGPL